VATSESWKEQERTAQFLKEALQELTDTLREHRAMLTGSEEPMTLRYLSMRFTEVRKQVEAIEKTTDLLLKRMELLEQRMEKARKWAEKRMNPAIQKGATFSTDAKSEKRGDQ
jgi:TATA-binding protein-associated factor Taf7